MGGRMKQGLRIEHPSKRMLGICLMESSENIHHKVGKCVDENGKLMTDEK